ncbi:hypothetical protein Golob_026830, partial [Gossypium lobatum]|nr:hypothetical protein [Gossypium lobatum]
RRHCRWPALRKEGVPAPALQRAQSPAFFTPRPKEKGISNPFLTPNPATAESWGDRWRWDKANGGGRGVGCRRRTALGKNDLNINTSLVGAPVCGDVMNGQESWLVEEKLWPEYCGDPTVDGGDLLKPCSKL